MRKSYKFTATVTDLKTGKRQQVEETATFEHPVDRREATASIRNQLARQDKPGTGITITD